MTYIQDFHYNIVYNSKREEVAQMSVGRGLVE